MAKSAASWEKRLGGRIRAFRLRADLTQQEAADRMGCPMRWWQSLEAGRNTTIDTLRRVSRVLGTEAWRLLQ